MTMNQARFGLLGIFVAGMLVQLVAFIIAGHRMWPEDLQALILKLLAIYAVQLTVVLVGIFANPRRRHLADPPVAVAWTAIVLAVLWNALLLWRSVSFSMASQDSASDLLKYLDEVSSASSFLVSGALVFFFVRGTEAAK